MHNKTAICVVLFLIVIPMASAVMTINPQKYEIREIEYNKPYSIIITAINPDASLFDIQIMINKESYYLLDFIKIEPTNFRISPNDKKNIKLTLTIPDTLSPEEHMLYLDFLSANHEIGKFKLSFEVPGDRVEKLVVDGISASVGDSENLYYFDYSLKNQGNIIVRGSPIVKIFDDGDLIDSFGEESSIMIMPGKDYNLTLMYDTTALAKGTYTYSAKFMYNDIETDYTEGTIMVNKKVSEYHDEIFVKEGEDIIYVVDVKNPSGELSFYNIQYNIFSENIGDTIEGQIQGVSKDVKLNIETSHLARGTYDMEIEVKEGRRLENTRLLKVRINVQSRSFLYIYLFIPSGMLAFGAFYILFHTKKKRKNHVSRYERLHKDFVSISHNYVHLEGSMKSFTKDISIFVHESNHWLKLNGYTHHGFK